MTYNTIWGDNLELYKEILTNVLAKGEVQITFANLNVSPNAFVESVCYQALCRIKEILKDEDLEDRNCFLKIEEVICLLEDLGIDCGCRHDG